jgi:hypothetical protein
MMTRGLLQPVWSGQPEMTLSRTRWHGIIASIGMDSPEEGGRYGTGAQRTNPPRGHMLHF